MLLIPAIDLKDGHCVRLKQGDMDQSTTFGEDPAAMARKWVDAGARRLHLVDLNGAFAGVPKNYSAIKSILKEVGDDIPVQLGGGIRDLDTIEKYIDGGLRYVIIGTAAVKNLYIYDNWLVSRPHGGRAATCPFEPLAAARLGGTCLVSRPM